MTPSPKEMKKLEKLAKVLNGGDIALLQEIDEFEQKVESEIETVKEVAQKALDIVSATEIHKGDDGYTPVKGKDYFDGEDYILTERDKKEIAKSITVPVVEKVIEKRETVIREVPVVTKEIIEKEVAILDDATVAYLEEEIKKVEDKIPEVVKKNTTNFGFVIRDVVAGTGVTIDKTDPNRPVVSAAGTGGGHTIEDEGTPLTQRDTLNFTGAGVTVTDAGGKTVVTISGAGSGAVDSVNGETGVVVLTTDDISDTAQTNKWATAAEKTKLGHISVTQAVDLDTMESDIASKQAGDADLTAIAALTPSNDDFIQRKAGAWTNRTVAQVKTDLGVVGSGLQLPTYVVAASGGDYTDIQSALDAAAANYPSGCTIYLADDSYTVTSTLQFKSSGVEIIGNGSGTIINCNGATVTTLFSSNADTYQRNALRNLYLNQTNATVQGVAIRAANMSLCIYDNIRILSFGTAINLDGSAANTFYNTFKDIKIFECNNGISIAGTNPVNDNMFQNIRISLRAGGAGTGVAISRGQSNNFYNLNVEPSAGTGITGLSITTANAFDNLFVGIYAEANATNVSIGSGVLRTTFIGGQIIGALTTNLSDSGTETSFFNTDVGSSVKNSWSPFTAIDTTSADKIAGYFSNNTTFAHTGGRLIQAQLLNATDTSIVLELNNAGSGDYISADSNFTVTKAGIVSSSGGFRPITNDTGALGSATLSFSDLFLASGAVINFNNGNATITHSAGLLTSNVDVAVPDEVYGAGWNGSLEVPTKNALYDKIETLGASGGVTLGSVIVTSQGFNMI